MRIVLVSTYVYPVALGMRYVSACLKQAGHDVSCLFMSSRTDVAEPLSPALRDAFVDHCREANVIGMSLMTNSFHRACELTTLLRNANVPAPIVWGGTHPTVAPEESADVADYLCIGEGEHAMLAFVDALAAGRDPTPTRGFAYRRNGRLVRNPAHPLITDLDALPFPDYDLDTHWVADRDDLVPACPERLRGALRRYRMSSTRGCPFACSFCNNATQLQIYKDAGYARHWVRKRSNENVIAEIEQLRGRYADVEAINLIDDLFLVRSEADIEAFADAYLQRVNLPLEIDAFPNTVTERKIQALSRLPIELISMGIQSGCQETLTRLYQRPTRVDRIADAIRIIAAHGLRAEYHYLVSNPFETDASRYETLRFAATHHRGPAKLRLFPLQFYPGSVMYHRARQEGLIGDRHEEAYRFIYTGKKHFTRLNYLEVWLFIVLSLRNAGLPPSAAHRLIDLITHRWTRRCLDRQWFAPAAFVGYRIARGLLKNLVEKPILRPLAAVRSRRRHLGSPSAQNPAHEHRAKRRVSHAA